MGPRKEQTSDSVSVASLDSKGKKKSFRRLIVRFAEKTSMQGVPYINNAKLWWARLIWVVLLLVAIGIMVFHLVYLFRQYYAWPINTKVTLGFSNLRFPDVTICNTNPIVRGKLWNYDGADELKALIQSLEPENLVPDQYSDDYDPYAEQGGQGGSNGDPNWNPTGGPNGMGPTTGDPAGGGSNPAPLPGKRRRKRFVTEIEDLNLTQYQRPDYVDPDIDRQFEEDEFDAAVDTQAEIQEIFTDLFMDLPRQVRGGMGHNITNMLLSCSYNERICYPHVFKLHQTAEYGNCWTIGSNKFVSKAAGPTGGLSLILYMETTEYLKGYTNGYGLRIAIHQNGSFPFPADLGIHVPSAMETDISLRLVEINRQGEPYGNCDEGDDFKKAYKSKFTRQACQKVCQIRKISEKCGCFDNEMETLATRQQNGTHACRSAKEVKCMENWNLKFQRKEESCPCLNPCQEIQYVKSVSNRQWPSDDYAYVLLEGICEEQPEVCGTLRGGMAEKRTLNYNFLKLNIYYEDLNFESITEEPEISVAQFLSDVGGAVGLWIGLSILSMVEVVQLICELIDYAVHKTLLKETRKERRRERERRHKANPQGRSNHRNGDVLGDRPNDPESPWPNIGFRQNGGHHPHRDDGSKGTDSWLDRHAGMRGDKYANYPPARDYHSDY